VALARAEIEARAAIAVALGIGADQNGFRPGLH